MGIGDAAPFILVSAVGSEWSRWRVGCFTPGGRAHHTDCVGRWVSPRTGADSRPEHKDLLFFRASALALRPTQSPIHCVSLRVKRPELEADRSASSSAVVKNEGSYTPESPCTFMACTGTSRFWARSQNCEKQLFASLCLSIRPSAWSNSAPTGRIFMKFDIWVFFENLSGKFSFH